MKRLILFTFILTGTYSFAQSIDLAMVLVEGGTFQMGNSSSPIKNEHPAHTVKLNNFYMGKYEVTQNIWQQVMGSNPSFYKDCAECPVETVTPEMVDEFLLKLNKLTGKNYRLPTEAEWEYAAEGGNQSKGFTYPGSNDLNEVAWFKPNAEDKTHPVGMKKPNELGLYDMAGNAWEQCSDYFDPAYYASSPEVNPRNDKKEQYKVVRGGSWRSGEERCYSKARNRNVYDHYHYGNGGFRLVLDK